MRINQVDDRCPCLRVATLPQVDPASAMPFYLVAGVAVEASAPGVASQVHFSRR